jgi:hypothetical protein
MVEVCWKDPAGRKYKAAALLEDISRSGMCLQFEIPVPEGTQVYVHCPGEKMTGTVRYCIYREIGYFVGIELEKTTLWSRKHFEEAREAIFSSGTTSGPSRQPFARLAGRLLRAAG